MLSETLLLEEHIPVSIGYPTRREVLRPEGQPTEPSIETTRQATFEWCEENESVLNRLKPNPVHQLREHRTAQQHCPPVERTGIDDPSRQRIDGVVLDHRDDTTRPDYSTHFADEPVPLRGGYVTEATDR